ncbi:MAG: ABC transporter permease [Desulfovibrionaceae bacterium]
MAIRKIPVPQALTAGLAVSSGVMVLAFIVLPLWQMVTSPSLASLWETIRDPEVLDSILLSLGTSLGAAAVCLVLGTPLAYLLARRNFRGKRLVESVIDLPIMIPHPVVGIALLTLAGRGHVIGDLLQGLGVQIMGTVTGIVTVCVYVGLPFFLNTAKAGFEGVPPRMEKVSRSLGASPGATFFRITLPLAWRHMLAGAIMAAGRAVSEFGAIVIVAYHPRIAPVLMYERFTSYGLKYSQPVAVWLILLCLGLFLLLRLLSLPRRAEA